MKSQILVRRYIHGLIGAIDGEAEYAEIFGELEAFGNVLSKQSQWEDVLTSRFLPQKKKMQLADEIIQSIGFHDKTARFLLLLVENGRLPLLKAILKALPDLWNESRGVSTFEVASVVHLTDDQRGKLQAVLEELEKNPVALKFALDPGLVGGLAVKKKNIVFDVSLKGELERMNETLKEG